MEFWAGPAGGRQGNGGFMPYYGRSAYVSQGVSRETHRELIDIYGNALGSMG
jgi:hypothetical protein